MVKRGTGTAALSRRERLLGGILLTGYLAVFPVIASRIFDSAEFLLGITLGRALRDAIYYYALSALTLLVFGGFWKRAARALSASPGRVFSSLGLGLVVFYGLNELFTRLVSLLPGQLPNLNDAAVSTRLDASPGSTIVIVVLLAPLVEETLFRGYVFGLLKERSRAGAYLFSCLLWALAHVWQYAAGDWTYLLAALQYIAPGLVMAWTCERAGSLWASVLLHGIVNALAVWSVL